MLPGSSPSSSPSVCYVRFVASLSPPHSYIITYLATNVKQFQGEYPEAIDNWRKFVYHSCQRLKKGIARDAAIYYRGCAENGVERKRISDLCGTIYASNSSCA